MRTIEQEGKKRKEKTELKLGSGRFITQMGLEGFSYADEDNLQRLSLLVHYQQFRIDVRYTDLIEVLKSEYLIQNPDNGGLESVYRGTILGRLHEIKTDHFKKLWEDISRFQGFSFFDYLQNASVEQLLYRPQHDFVQPVYRSTVRLMPHIASDLVIACRDTQPLGYPLPIPQDIRYLLSQESVAMTEESLPF